MAHPLRLCAKHLRMLAASTCLLAATAGAQTVDITPEGTVAFTPSVQGSVNHHYNFSIAEGSALSFSALASFGPNNSSWIEHFAAALFEGGELLDTALWRRLPLFRWEELEFAPRVLGPGEYSLHIDGLVDGETQFPTTTYRLTMQFSAAAPVPEAPTVGLIAAGLAMLIVMARLRMGNERCKPMPRVPGGPAGSAQRTSPST